MQLFQYNRQLRKSATKTLVLCMGTGRVGICAGVFSRMTESSSGTTCRLKPVGKSAVEPQRSSSWTSCESLALCIRYGELHNDVPVFAANAAVHHLEHVTILHTVMRLRMSLMTLECVSQQQGASQGSPSMSEKSCTIRTRKFLTNRLLARRQFVSARVGSPDMHTVPLHSRRVVQMALHAALRRLRRSEARMLGAATTGRSSGDSGAAAGDASHDPAPLIGDGPADGGQHPLPTILRRVANLQRAREAAAVSGSPGAWPTAAEMASEHQGIADQSGLSKRSSAGTVLLPSRQMSRGKAGCEARWWRANASSGCG